MNKITIESSGKTQVYRVPSSFDEMTREQFILTATKLLETTNQSINPSILQSLNPSVSQSLNPSILQSFNYFTAITGIPKKTWNALLSYQRHCIRQLFDFVADISPAITKQLLPYIETGGQQLIGYQPGFSNTTWQEFIFADQYILSGKFKEAAACLYRPQRPDYTGETDRRIPFSIYGTNSRLPHFQNLPEAELFAFVLNYKALRKHHLEDKYPFVFPDAPNAQFSTLNSQFSWVSIHRNLMGDHFYDETKFYDLNVHVILNRLNSTIKDNRKKK